MAVVVNPPPRLRIPEKFRVDPEIRSFFEQQVLILFQLWNRTGGPDDTISEIETVRVVDQGIQFPSEDEGEVFTAPTIDEAKEWRSLTANVDITAHGYDFIAAASSLTVRLPEFPDWDDIVTVLNVNGKRVKTDGNGKLINGSTSTTSLRKNTTINYHYFHELDAWYMR